jgi:hypothetical protein
MDDDLRARRQELTDRHDALAPEGGRPGAAPEELCAVAEGLEGVAGEAERRGNASIEIARTLRWAGMAYLDAAPSMDEAITRRGLTALTAADRHTDREAHPADAAKADYCVGRALMNLSTGEDGSIARQAVDRLTAARAAAREHAPELLPGIGAALVTAEQVAVLREQADKLDRQIRPETTEEPDIKRLFGILQQEVGRDSPTVDPVRRESLSDIMEALSGLVDTTGTDRSLGQMAVEQERLEKLLQRMKALDEGTGE